MRGVTDLTFERFESNPLITPSDDEAIGENINGPDIIKAPPWLDDPLGEYYCYFAHHQGEYIRLAYSDDLRGPWTVHPPGTLQLEGTRFTGHIASPDVHVDDAAETVRMYFHGCCGDYEHPAGTFHQVTDVAISHNGLDFEVVGTTLGTSYFRVFQYDGSFFALANDGHLYESEDPHTTFERHHQCFPTNRHFAVRFLDPETLQVFLSRRGDRPERIMVGTIDCTQPIEHWRCDPHPPETVVWPAREYEGANEPLETSESGSVHEPVRQLRDPAIFEETDKTYLFYSIAGEAGIAGGELKRES